MSAEKIINSWKKKDFKPVYWLEGEEDFYIDQVMQFAEHKLLPESEAGFNLSIFYGKDANWADVVNACMRYPMFADRQVVLLKEAQQMKDIDKLENYIEKPLGSTVFVVGYKEKKLDGRSGLAKLLKKNAEILTTKKLYENELQPWASELVESKGFTISSKALALLVDHIGNDLSRINNEVEKLTINLAGRRNITEDDIEEYIGVSKEYNPFELQDALGKKDLARCMKIIQYFEANPKAAAIQMILPSLYNYFAKIYTIFGMSDKSENAVKPLFYGIYYAAKGAIETSRAYGYEGVEKTLLLLHEYNLKSIGINDNGSSDADLMKEMVVKIIMK
ncbi:MAG: DNA polymerase III subunit delta [Flavihumibacter sp.]|nr:DNA polymerase III subunit delta [Flavihumibacter sp.]